MTETFHAATLGGWSVGLTVLFLAGAWFRRALSRQRWRAALDAFAEHEMRRSPMLPADLKRRLKLGGR
jgi:hypothetical protein